MRSVEFEKKQLKLKISENEKGHIREWVEKRIGSYEETHKRMG